MNGMHSFANQKQQAINQINEMKKRAQTASKKTDTNKKSEINLPIKSESNRFSLKYSLTDDTLIILGLILILSNDNNDMLLLLALVYILM